MRNPRKGRLGSPSFRFELRTTDGPFCYLYSWFSKNLSASIAAMHPVPAAVTAWR